MSILINGIEMPKSCWDCFACHDGWCIINQKIEGHRTVTHSCPLIEVQPHGRLIDADALLESIKEAKKKQPEISDVYDEDYFAVAEWVAYAPTVIKSEDD